MSNSPPSTVDVAASQRVGGIYASIDSIPDQSIHFGARAFSAQSREGLRLSAINGLRGMALLCVLYQHTICIGLCEALEKVSFAGIPLSVIPMKSGWVSVNLFFMLSAFVLFLPYYTGRRRLIDRESFADFYQRRFDRLMPLFLINCFVCAFIAMRTQPFWWDSFWRTITTVSMFSDYHWFPPINPALWTLMLEIYFSIVCPVLILALGRFGWRPIIISVFSVAFVTRLIGFSTDHVSIFDSLPARLDDFLAGMLLCKFYLENRLRLKPNTLMAIGLGLLIVGCLLSDMRTAYHTLPPYAAPIINNVVQVALFAFVLGALRCGGFLKKVFSCYPLQLMGMMCYSIYIWHLVMLAPLVDGWYRHPMHLATYAIWLLVFSALSYRYIEFGKEKNWKKLFTPPKEQ